ncbi:Predicted amidohydrolase [Jiangella sp. DSM 45060]|nr:Predicted amidohydrolase [Jiangella sp. DSM 45060]
MVNRVTVATVSAEPLRLGAEVRPADAGQRMIAHWRDRLETVRYARPDLVVLPEHCDRPAASYPADLLEEYFQVRGDRVRDAFVELAAEIGANIAYSGLRVTPDGRFNSTQLIDRRGEIAGVYDKTFLTDGEAVTLTPGTGARGIQLDFGLVAPAICFDLNFDELLRDVAGLGPDLVAFSSAFHGGSLQTHWAYTARAHFAGAVYPPARSAVLSPFGEVIASSTNYRHEAVGTVNLDTVLIHIDHNGPKFDAIRREYGPDVRIHDPGLIGVVALSSEREGLSATDVIERFELERLDEYFARVRERQPRRSGSPLTRRSPGR